MHTARLIFTLVMALILMGCPPPVGDNPTAPASEVNDSAQSGNNPNDSASGGLKPEPKAIVVAQISAGNAHTMILTTDDSLWSAGFNHKGQLGGGYAGTPRKKILTKVMTGVDQVSAGTNYTMIVKKGGVLWAVGKNNSGQLGYGTKDDKSDWVQGKTAGGDPIIGVKQVSASEFHTMIVTKDDTLWAVGNNEFGQLGDGSTAGKLTWVAVKEKSLGGGVAPAMTEVARVSAGAAHTMIVKKSGALWAVGNNDFGQLGDGTTNSKNTAVQVMIDADNPMTEVDQVSSGAGHTMILKNNDSLWAVGFNHIGQLGDNTTANKKIPVQVLEIPADSGEPQPMTDVKQVSAGNSHTVILKENGEVWAVGDNRVGQLGDGTTENKKIPVQVMIAADRPMTNVAQVSAGQGYTVILKKNGSLWAVGNNSSGQLGDGKGGPNVVKLFPVEITVE